MTEMQTTDDWVSRKVDASTFIWTGAVSEKILFTEHFDNRSMDMHFQRLHRKFMVSKNTESCATRVSERLYYLCPQYQARINAPYKLTVFEGGVHRSQPKICICININSLRFGLPYLRLI